MKPDVHYQVLEIEPGASQDDIKQAYKDLAKVWHPDRFASDPRLQHKAEEKLKQINAAYEFLKTYQPQVIQTNVEHEPKQSVVVSPSFEKLDQLLQLGKLKDADSETKRLLLELAGREKDGWLCPDDIKNLPSHALSAIDQLWLAHSNGRFGFSVQSRVWRSLGCTLSGDILTQTISENKFGQSVGWRKANTWLFPLDSFNYDIQAPQGSLPRDYIFTLSGWWSYSKGWVGYLIWKFDAIFLKL